MRRRNDLIGTIGLAIMIVVIVASFAWTAISGTDFTGRGHYTPSERIVDAAIAVGLSLLAYATFRSIQRVRKATAQAHANIAARIAAEDEPPPPIKYEKQGD